MITSRKHLFHVDEIFNSDPMFIPALKGTKPVDLFLSKAERHREISINEIVEFIKMDKSFDLNVFTRG